MYVTNPLGTIAAVSTPRGKGGIATVRISGADTVEILEKCFVPKGAPLKERPFRTAVFGSIIKDGTPIDTGICILYAEGKSFTGEIMAELSCHGGIYITNEVLEAVLSAGASPAGPGEFTKRAFINGKMTLSEAEAVGLLIDSDTKSKARLAGAAVSGKISGKLASSDKKLFDVMTALYAAIDYPEEDVGSEGEDRIYQVVCEVYEDITRLLCTFSTGRAIAEGIETVICGKPNAGKSSLYNLLLGEERAIVTDIAGTTRDTLEESADIGGITLRLCDTAGIHTPGDTVEKIGIDRAYKKLESAGLIIFVTDASRALDSDEKNFIEALPGYPGERICVLNKTDLGRNIPEDDTAVIEKIFPNVCEISALEEKGISELEKIITSLYNSEALTPGEDAIIWDINQQASLDRAAQLLLSAKEALEAGAPLDAVGVVCEEALSEIRMVDGRDVSEDIIDGIFSRFCVGK